MKKVNTKNKSSARKKLIPAAGSLLVSAAMLGTSTYAWFTMSREVEVKNIQMTATVPEDLQISPGWTTANATTSKGNQTAYDLNGTASFLSGTGNDGVANLAAVAPDPNNLQMWSNTLDISHYYALGKIIPASSTSGSSIFFTPDANGVGKTVKQNAAFYTAAAGLNAQADSGSTQTYQTSKFAKGSSTTLTSGAWTGYSGADKYNKTNDDGYYADIPLWIRSSSDAEVKLSVDAYVIPQDDSKYGDANVELYRAARVVVIPDTSDTSSSGTKGLIKLKDGSGTGFASTKSVVNFYGDKHASGTTLPSGAVKAAGTLNGYNSGATFNGDPNNWGDIYDNAVTYDNFASSPADVLTIPGSANKQYGDAVKFWVRVWLEGEDPECWNQNAGQNFSISLKFEKIDN